MAYKFVPYAPEGSGGKDPILGELVVTENGVYDNPTIEGERSITWDGVIGDKTCVYMDGATRTVGFVKVSDYVLSFDNFVAGTLATSNGQQHIMDENALMNIPDVGINCGALVVAVCDVDAFNATDLAMGSTFTDEGTYFFFNPQIYISSFAFSDSTPADGWNKVTVNVAGDIVDVSELPTEVDEGKIYRVTTAGEPVTEIWHSIPPSVIEGMGGGLNPLTRNDEFIKTSMGSDVTYELRVVDTLPEVGEPSVMGQSFYIYVVNDPSSEAFLFIEGTGWVPGSAADFGEYTGVVGDKGDIQEPTDDSTFGYYILKRAGASSTTYGIPDEANNKTVMEHNGSEWVAVNNDIVDVPELPTENIEEGKIYRVTKESEPVMWIVGTVDGEALNMSFVDYLASQGVSGHAVSMYVVDIIPDADTMEPVDVSTYKYPCYVVESTGIGYVFINQPELSGVYTFGVAMGCLDGGWVDSVDDIIFPETATIYTVRGSSSTTYGIPDEDNNKTVMEHNGSEWVECGSLTGTIPVIDVAELPTEDINENALYRIVSVDVFIFSGNMAGNIKQLFSNTVIQIVETLPETPELSSFDSMVVYVLNDTGNVYVSMDGSTYIPFAEAIGASSEILPNFGWVENESMMTRDGIYAICKDARYMCYDGIFVCINEHASPQVKFVLNDSGDGYIVNGNGNYAGDVTIPSEHDGLPVTSVGSFENCRKVYTITMPDSITSIGDSAFENCNALSSVKLSKNVSVIPRRAFYESRIRSLGSNDGVDKFYAITEIGERAFMGSCIKEFPQCPNLVTIGKEAFKDCGMLRYSYIANEDEGNAVAGVSEPHLLVPESVKTIGSGAFEHTFFGQVDFCGTPESIDSTVFKDCPHIRTIQVPWAEGAVEGAPWGATNATVYYNRKQST